MPNLKPEHFEQAVQVADLLNKAAGKLRVLSSVEWQVDFKRPFLEKGKLPNPKYVNINTTVARELLGKANGIIGTDNEIFDWLRRVCLTLEQTACLIETRGTSDFFHYSAQLFGRPTDLMIDRKTRVLDLAKYLDSALEDLNFDKLVIEGEEETLTAEVFAEGLRSRLDYHFGKASPKVVLAPKLSSKAAATSKRIRVRSSASFTPRDIDQLLHHEALVHAATGKNGQAQKHFKLLGRSHAGTTEIQEGLAVFAEIITGVMDPMRFSRLSARVLAIEMAIQGADFKEVFDYFVERNDDPSQSYENTRRIFRGGVISGGAPFTKDMVYLNGLLRVHNFMRTVVKLNRADLIRVLFAGKMDIEDVPALAQLAHNNQLNAPKFMPPWVKDLRFLVSYMAYSGFLNQVKLPGFQAYYAKELDDVPNVWEFGK